MKRELKIKDYEEIENDTSYGSKEQGVEEVYRIREGEKDLKLFLSPTALEGNWLMVKDLKTVLGAYKMFFKKGDKIEVKSYKQRSIDETLSPKSDPDCIWDVELI